MLVMDLNGKNHQMNILNLLHPIDPNESFKKVKIHLLCINCKYVSHSSLSHLF